MSINIDYKDKYIKYKIKYFKLLNYINSNGGMNPPGGIHTFLGTSFKKYNPEYFEKTYQPNSKTLDSKARKAKKVATIAGKKTKETKTKETKPKETKPKEINKVKSDSTDNMKTTQNNNTEKKKVDDKQSSHKNNSVRIPTSKFDKVSSATILDTFDAGVNWVMGR